MAAIPSFAICWARKPPRQSSYKHGAPVMMKTRKPLRRSPSISAPFTEKTLGFPPRMAVLPCTEWPCWCVYTNSSMPCELWRVHRQASRQKKLLDAKQKSTKFLHVVKHVSCAGAYGSTVVYVCALTDICIAKEWF